MRRFAALPIAFSLALVVGPSSAAERAPSASGEVRITDGVETTPAGEVSEAFVSDQPGAAATTVPAVSAGPSPQAIRHLPPVDRPVDLRAYGISNRVYTADELLAAPRTRRHGHSSRRRSAVVPASATVPASAVVPASATVPASTTVRARKSPTADRKKTQAEIQETVETATDLMTPASPSASVSAREPRVEATGETVAAPEATPEPSGSSESTTAGRSPVVAAIPTEAEPSKIVATTAVSSEVSQPTDESPSRPSIPSSPESELNAARAPIGEAAVVAPTASAGNEVPQPTPPGGDSAIAQVPAMSAVVTPACAHGSVRQTEPGYATLSDLEARPTADAPAVVVPASAVACEPGYAEVASDADAEQDNCGAGSASVAAGPCRGVGCDSCRTCLGGRLFWGLRCMHCGRGPYMDRFANCGCDGSYKFPVPPLYTYHWPGMYSQQLMTDYHSPWRFPPLQAYSDESPVLGIPKVTQARGPVAVRPASRGAPTVRRRAPIAPVQATLEPESRPSMSAKLEALYGR